MIFYAIYWFGFLDMVAKLICVVCWTALFFHPGTYPHAEGKNTGDYIEFKVLYISVRRGVQVACNWIRYIINGDILHFFVHFIFLGG